LVTQGNLAAGLKSYSAGAAIVERLAKSDPGNAVWQRDQSVMLGRVGDILVAQGEVAEALSTFARRSGTAIVVMGAVSRSAIMRWFIGNTAERTLDRLTCDALIVKPRGFRSGIERAAALTATRSGNLRGRPRRSRGAAVAARAVPPPFL